MPGIGSTWPSRPCRAQPIRLMAWTRQISPSQTCSGPRPIAASLTPHLLPARLREGFAQGLVGPERALLHGVRRGSEDGDGLDHAEPFEDLAGIHFDLRHPWA